MNTSKYAWKYENKHETMILGSTCNISYKIAYFAIKKWKIPPMLLDRGSN